MRIDTEGTGKVMRSRRNRGISARAFMAGSFHSFSGRLDPIWHVEPEFRGAECPRCGGGTHPRLVTWDGVDAGTGERMHEERYRCSCGFEAGAEEFEIAGPSGAAVAGATGRKPRPLSGLMTTSLPGVITDVELTAARTMDGKATDDMERPRGINAVPAPASVPNWRDSLDDELPPF